MLNRLQKQTRLQESKGLNNNSICTRNGNIMFILGSRVAVLHFKLKWTWLSMFYRCSFSFVFICVINSFNSIEFL